MDDEEPEPDLIINHLNDNHYSPDSSLDSELDPSGPADGQENHMDPLDPQLRDSEDEVVEEEEEDNGRPPAGELSPGSEGGPELVLVDDQLTRYLSPAALKKHIHTETAKVNNELRALITKEIRKPGRRK